MLRNRLSPRTLTRWLPRDRVVLNAVELETRDQASVTSNLPLADFSDAGNIAAILSTTNAPPVNTVPGAQFIAEDTDLTFSPAKGNPISVADPDAAAGDIISVSLSVDSPHKIKLKTKNGLTFTAGGDDKTSMTFQGTQANINAALNGLVLKKKDGFQGIVTLTMTTNDLGNAGTGGAQSDTDTVKIYVDVPITPSAGNDGYYTGINSTLIVPVAGVLANDSDPLGTSLTALLVSGPSNGSVTLSGDGSFVYTPNNGQTGTDNFTYRANNGLANSNLATVTISVVNQSPVIASNGGGTSATVNVSENTTAVTAVAATDADVPAQTLTYSIIGGADAAKFTINSTTGALSFITAPNYELPTDSGANNVYNVAVRASDNYGGFDTQAIAVQVLNANDRPVAGDYPYSTSVNTALVVPASGVLGNDTDEDGNTLTASVVVGPANGALALAANGAFTYTPNANFYGTDSFTYRDFDGLAYSNVATVTISVIPKPPVAANNSYATTVNNPLNVAASGVLANDTDPQALGLNAVLVTGPTHGTLALNADGSFIYTPNANYFGSDGFTYKANDGLANSNLAIVSLTVNSLPPVGTADGYATNVNAPLSVSAAAGVLANDTDPQARPLTAVLVSGTANGTLAFNANGSFTYTANANFTGTDSFTYRANDGLANSNPTTVTLAVNALPPTAYSDSYTTNANSPLTVAISGVLANDTDPQARTLSAVLVAGPTNGTLALNANGSFTYTPNANYFGSDTFTYQASDGLGFSGTATVSLTINALPPTAGGDALSTFVNTPLVVAASGLLANDTDPQALPLSAVLVTAPAHGSLALNADGSFTYTPNAGFAGADSFTYRASDGVRNSNIAAVSLSVVSRPPIAADDSYTTAEDSLFNGDVLANDTDPDGDTLSATLLTDVANGALSLNTDGSFTYIPLANWSGTDSFTYTVNDGRGGTDTGTVTLTVTAVNDAPVALGNSYTTVGVLPLNISGPGVLSNDSDIEGDSLTAILVSAPSNGILILNPDGSFVYTANPLFVGTDTFTYRADDGQASSGIATVSIRVGQPNRAPVVNGDGYSVLEDTPLNATVPGVLGNDADPDGDTIAAALVSGTTNGALVFNADGSFAYTPNADFYGTDSFSYRASDGSLTSSLATVTINVMAVNDPPTLAAIADLAILEDAGVQTVSLAGIGAGPSESQSLTVTATSSDPSLIPNPLVNYTSPSAGGTLTFAPVANANGAATITITVDDGIATISRSFTVTVAAVNDAPVANNDSKTTSEDTPVTLNVRANDTDIDGDPLTISAVTQGANGTAVVIGGSVKYTPNANFHGTDSFTYTISDGNGGTATATVNINVTPVNDAPVANYDAFATPEDGILFGDVTANDSDVDGDTLVATLIADAKYGTVNLAPDGTFSYSPNADFNGNDSFLYQLSDGNGGTTTAIVALTVTPVDDAPVALADVYVGAEGTVQIGNVLDNDSDIEGDPLIAVLLTGAANGTVTMAGDGSFSYTPDAGFAGQDTFSYQVSDGQQFSGVVNATIFVIPTPTASVASTHKPVPTTAGTLGSPGSVPDAIVREVAASGETPRDRLLRALVETANRKTKDGELAPLFVSTAGRFSEKDAVKDEAAPVSAIAPPSEPRLPTPTVVTPETRVKSPLPFTPTATAAVAPAILPPRTVEPPDSTLTEGLAATSPVFKQLDQLNEEFQGDAQTQALTDTVVVSGAMAGAGYVFLNTRVVYWFLSALLARPAVWRRFDPLDVIYAWEQERDGKEPENEESLQSMVG